MKKSRLGRGRSEKQSKGDTAEIHRAAALGIGTRDNTLCTPVYTEELSETYKFLDLKGSA